MLSVAGLVTPRRGRRRREEDACCSRGGVARLLPLLKVILLEGGEKGVEWHYGLSIPSRIFYSPAVIASSTRPDGRPRRIYFIAAGDRFSLRNKVAFTARPEKLAGPDVS